MSESSVEHLVKMANQIAVSVPAAAPEDKVANAAVHIQKFWSPMMKKKLGDYLDGGGSGLTVAAAKAVALANKQNVLEA